MLQTNELRIGNRITYAGKEIIVEGIVRNTIHHSNGQFDQNISPAYEPFKGIKPTQERLLKAGFDEEGKIDNERYVFDIYFLDCWHIDFHTKVGYGYSECILSGDFYLHDIQNIFFHLTGEELVFSTEP